MPLSLAGLQLPVLLPLIGHLRMMELRLLYPVVRLRERIPQEKMWMIIYRGFSMELVQGKDCLFLLNFAQ